MNPLPRYLAFGLFVVLAALSALLAAPVWRSLRAEQAARTPAAAAATPTNPPPPARMVILTQRFALFLAVASAALALTLIVSLAAQATRSGGSRTPFATVSKEIDTLAKLAESTNAQGAELNRERDVRRRAEEDAELKQRLLAQSVDEKVRLGRDLHDGIIQSLYAVGLTLESVRAIVKSDPDEADRRLEQMRATLNNTIRDVRAYITGLTPGSLRRIGFSHAVDTMLQELGASRDTEFDVKIDDDAAARLSADQTVEALQIAREAVSNALRHGGASRITVRVHQSDREICLLVQDNGVGFNAGSRIGASLRVTSSPGEGARVIATLPILQSTVV
jgi:signal transduction histidine kinase